MPDSTREKVCELIEQNGGSLTADFDPDSPVFAATSELSRHTEMGATRDDEDDSWILAGENESVDSFLTNCPPSFVEKSWISAQHDGQTQLIEEYYAAQLDEGAVRGRDAP